MREVLREDVRVAFEEFGEKSPFVYIDGALIEAARDQMWEKLEAFMSDIAAVLEAGEKDWDSISHITSAAQKAHEYAQAIQSITEIPEEELTEEY